MAGRSTKRITKKGPISRAWSYTWKKASDYSSYFFIGVDVSLAAGGVALYLFASDPDYRAAGAGMGTAGGVRIYERVKTYFKDKRKQEEHEKEQSKLYREINKLKNSNDSLKELMGEQESAIRKSIRRQLGKVVKDHQKELEGLKKYQKALCNQLERMDVELKSMNVHLTDVEEARRKLYEDNRLLQEDIRTSTAKFEEERGRWETEFRDLRAKYDNDRARWDEEKFVLEERIRELEDHTRTLERDQFMPPPSTDDQD